MTVFLSTSPPSGRFCPCLPFSCPRAGSPLVAAEVEDPLQGWPAFQQPVLGLSPHPGSRAGGEQRGGMPSAAAASGNERASHRVSPRERAGHVAAAELMRARRSYQGLETWTLPGGLSEPPDSRKLSGMGVPSPSAVRRGLTAPPPGDHQCWGRVSYLHGGSFKWSWGLGLGLGLRTEGKALGPKWWMRLDGGLGADRSAAAPAPRI